MPRVKIIQTCYKCDYYDTASNRSLGFCGFCGKEIMDLNPDTNGICPLPSSTTDQNNWQRQRNQMADEYFLALKRRKIQ